MISSSPPRCIGVDIGSRTTCVAVVEDGALVHSEVFLTGVTPLDELLPRLESIGWRPGQGEGDGDGTKLVATGYGRHHMAERLGVPVVTELNASVAGVRTLAERAGGGAWDCPRPPLLLLDVGGEDTKAVLVEEGWLMADFVLNDRCAAGTGRFLEMAAAALGLDVDAMVEEASAADEESSISSVCAVFAESELVSRVAAGERRDTLARGVHRSVVSRISSQLSMLDAGCVLPVVFVGGGALNRCLVEMLKEEGWKVVVPPEPQVVVALGAAVGGCGC